MAAAIDTELETARAIIEVLENGTRKLNAENTNLKMKMEHTINGYERLYADHVKEIAHLRKQCDEITQERNKLAFINTDLHNQIKCLRGYEERWDQ